MSSAYSLSPQPKTSSPLARNPWHAADLPAVVEKDTSNSSIDQVGLAHDRLRTWLDEEDAEILLGRQDHSKRKRRRTKRQNQKKGTSLGRVKDLQIEAGVFAFEERDKIAPRRRKCSVSGTNDAVAKAGVEEGFEIGEASQHHVAAMLRDASLPLAASEPSVDSDIDNDDGNVDASIVSVSGRKRSFSTSDVVARRRKRYHHDFCSNSTRNATDLL